MIDKIKIKNDTHYSERVDLLINKVNEIIESLNMLETFSDSSFQDIKFDILSLTKDVKSIESNVGLLITTTKNKSINNDIFIKSVLEKISMLKNMIVGGNNSIFSTQLEIVKKIESEIEKTGNVTKEQLIELNEIYGNVKTRIL